MLLNKIHLYSVYFAPRGRERLLNLGSELSQRHLVYSDKLVGIVGDAGSGKSLIIKGMFPGLSLLNDDDSIDARKIMQVRDLDKTYDMTAYHLDMRFQMAFTQMYEIVDFINGALAHGRRVIVEHFDLLYPALGKNADIMIGVGQEIVVTRPNIFGPVPRDIYDIVFASVRNRRMAHTAEDLTTLVMSKEYGLKFKIDVRGDVRGGFVLNFREKPEFDISELESKVQELIDAKLDVSYYDEESIKIGSTKLHCTGPRIHMRNTGDIENFFLLKEIKYDHLSDMYVLVGLVGNKDVDLDDLNKIKKEAF